MRNGKIRTRNRIGVDGVAVILRSNFYFARKKIFDGMISAAMPEFQYVFAP